MLINRLFLTGLFLAAGTEVLAQPAQGNLSSHLRNIQSEYQAHLATQSGTAFTPQNPSVQLFKHQYVAVDITLKNTLNDTSIAKLKKKLTKLGMRQISQYKKSLSGIMPIDRLSKLAQQPNISWVSSNKAARRALGAPGGRAYNAADTAMFTDVVRKQYEVDGSGVVIGVLSDSYDCLNGAADDIATGDLPTDVRVLKEYPFCADGATDEGRAMMQLIHAIAPGAKLMFYTASVSAIDFAQGIQSLANAGANIIVDDIGYYTMPYFQPDPIAQSVNEVKAKGVSYFSAAGNDARLSYENDYEAGVSPFSQDKAHDFGIAAGGASNFYQKITLPSNQSISLTLQWDDPAEIAGGKGAKTDLDVFLLDHTQRRIVSSSQDNNIGHNPVEFISINHSSDITDFYLYISHRAGPAPTHIKYIIHGPTPDWPTTTSSEVIELKVDTVKSIIVMPDGTPLTGGTAVIVNGGITEIGTTKLPIRVDTDGNPLVDLGGVIQVGPGTKYPIWFVPTGFTAAIGADGIVLYQTADKIITTSIDQYPTYSSTIFGHPNAAGAIAVGAMSYNQAPWFGFPLTQSKIESFSSAGGTPIYFKEDGTRLATPLQLLKPEIVAPDDTDTTFFGADTDLNGLPNFQGTSAAAPHAAAMAALLLNAYPSLKPDDIYKAMKKGSLDLSDPAGVIEPIPVTTECASSTLLDWATGCGLVQADLVFLSMKQSTLGVFLTLKPLPSQIKVGVKSTYQFRLNNLSGAPLKDVKLNSGDFSTNLTINTVDGCSETAKPFAPFCSLGDIEAGDSKIVTVTATAVNIPSTGLVVDVSTTSGKPAVDIPKAHLSVNVATPNVVVIPTPHISAGDLNHDNCVDKTDWGLLFGRFRIGGSVLPGSGYEEYDLTKDNKLGLDDLTALEQAYSNPPSGNACN